MSDQKRNTGCTDDMDFSALDEELARMAEETPEVPADFHDNWTRMIRQEAAAGKPATTAEKNRKGRGQLRYIMSMAAAFVVLIGGVVLARNNGLLRGTPSAQEAPVLMANSLTAGETSEAAETAYYEDAAIPMEPAGLLGMSADSMPEPAPEAENMAAARKAEAAESVQDSASEAPMLMATSLPAGPDLTEPAAGMTDTDAEADERESVSAGETETSEASAAMPADSVENPAPETAEDDKQDDSRSFLQRAWEGILDAVPWILGGAIIVLFMLTYVIRPGKKQ